MRKKTRVFAVLVAVLAVGFWMPRSDDFFELRKNYQIFGALYEQLVTAYVDEVEPGKLMRTGLTAMLADLDPYTNFYDEADNGDIDIMARGRYGDVGLSLGERGGRIFVLAPAEGASAFQQGIRTGDVLVEVGGRPTTGLSVEDLAGLLRGEPGTAIEVVIEREGARAPLSFRLMRAEIEPVNVPFFGFLDDDADAGLGYIKLDRFGNGGAAEVRKALQALQESGSLKGLLLDLRSNPGGLLEDAVAIVGLFVPQGTLVVTTRGRLEGTTRPYRTEMPPLAPDLPLAILVDETSASASEIVAGALQDHDRAAVVGAPTFGKGLVQIFRNLPFNTSLKITTARYYIPSGRSIQAIDYRRHDGAGTTIPDSLRRAFVTAAGRVVKDGRGVEPDVDVTPPPPSELEKALDRRAAFFFFANRFAAERPAPADPAAFTVTDADLAAFRAWLADQDFGYRTPAEHATDDLTDRLADHGYDAHAELATLRAEIAREKARDFDRHADRLKTRLRDEILARYLGDTDQLKAAMPHDAHLTEARRLLTNPAAYAALLGR